MPNYLYGGRSHWRVNNRFKMYNPLKQNEGHIRALKQQLGDRPKVKYISMISFTMRCRFCIDPELRKIHSDELIVYDVELSEFIHRKITRLKAENSSPLLTDEEIKLIYEKVIHVNITDPKVRAEHIEKIPKR